MCSCRLITLKLIDLLALPCPESTGMCGVYLQPFSETRNHSECPCSPICLAFLPAQPPPSCLFPHTPVVESQHLQTTRQSGVWPAQASEGNIQGVPRFLSQTLHFPTPSMCSSYTPWRVILVAWLLLVTTIGAFPNVDYP